MKKRFLMFMLLFILVTLICSIYPMQLVGADSGFDSSYDSGSSSSDGNGGDLFYLIYLCIEYPPLGIALIIFIIYRISKSVNNQKKVIDDALRSRLELLNYNNYPENKRLEIEAFNIYKSIQYAWMNFNEDLIRNYTTDEMYNMYLMQLDTLKLKNQQNIMHDIKYISSNIINRYTENDQETIIILMNVSCYDFIIDTKTKKVVRGNAGKINYYKYELTFVRTVNTKTLNKCPRCGAPVEGNSSGVCEYCRSTLINNDYTLVLSKKIMKSQK